MKILITIIIYLAAGCANGQSFPCFPEEKVIIFVESNLNDDSIYYVVSEATDVDDNGRQLLIVDSKCNKKLLARYFDWPLSIYPLTDENRLLASMWMSGTSYVMRIFELPAGKIIAEFSSRAPPSIVWLSNFSYPFFYLEKDLRLEKYGWLIFDEKIKKYRYANKKEVSKILQKTSKLK